MVCSLVLLYGFRDFSYCLLAPVSSVSGHDMCVL
jgi:hypothetical protein